MIYNPIDILKELLNEICAIDKESFDRAELDCYRKNLLMRNFVFVGSLYDRVEDITNYINYHLVYSNGKVMLKNKYDYVRFTTKNILPLERGDIINVKSNDTMINGDYKISYILDNNEIVARRIHG